MERTRAEHSFAGTLAECDLLERLMDGSPHGRRIGTTGRIAGPTLAVQCAHRLSQLNALVVGDGAVAPKHLLPTVGKSFFSSALLCFRAQSG